MKNNHTNNNAVYMPTPTGTLEIGFEERGITSIQFVEKFTENIDEDESNPPFWVKKCIEQLQAYFEGKQERFDLPLTPQGTDFQQKVWTELQKIPYGKTASYLDIANRLGDPKAVRAVGMANGKNPIAIVVPCHRVIGANGKLTGYAGGLERKQFLLDLERKNKQLNLFDNQ